MIRLLQDCDARVLFKRNHPECLRRYWVFLAYGSPIYSFPPELNIPVEDEDLYIDDFLFKDHAFIDAGKFDLAFPVFGMDEWTSIIGFVSDQDEAPKIAKYISENNFSPETVIARYPNIELLEFAWIDGWWEVYGNLDIVSDIIEPDLIYIDTEASIYLNSESDEEVYTAARNQLDHYIQLNQPA